MNIFTAVMLVFAFIGLIDKMFGSKTRLSSSFDKGLLTMGTMTVSIIGVSCVGVAFISNHSDFILSYLSKMPFDPSVLGGMLLAADMGGFAISSQLTSDVQMLVLNGVVLSSLFGQFVTFQLPVITSATEKENLPGLLKGFMIGIIVIPVGLMVSGFLLHLRFLTIIRQMVPILVLCVILILGLMKAPKQALSIFQIVVNLTQFLVCALFLLTILGIFIPDLAYADMDSVQEISVIVLKSTIIICGSMVLCESILKFFRAKLQKLALKLGTNEISIVAMLLNCATSLAILPLLGKMDDKGRMLNAAFSVSGAYFLGGQLGFVSSVASPSTVTVYLAAKVLCGFASMALVHVLYDRLNKF